MLGFSCIWIPHEHVRKVSMHKNSKEIITKQNSFNKGKSVMHARVFPALWIVAKDPTLPYDLPGSEWNVFLTLREA